MHTLNENSIAEFSTGNESDGEIGKLERVNGLEPSTYTLARYRSSQLSYTRILRKIALETR